MTTLNRLIVGITGATGAIYGVSLLRCLGSLPGWESHLVLSDAGVLNAWHELKMKRKDCNDLKGEIEAKIKNNGVEKFTLDIVDKDAQAEGKVVGTCDGGTKKIVYKRGG